jgi:GR25 family glycosyltransferase involved in LPS biosynthesis
MEKQFAEMGIMDKVTRINAIDGKNIKNIYQGNIQSIQYSANYIKKITQYELACTLSHLLTIKKAYDNGNDIALILEDDAYLGFAYFWPESLEKYTQKFPQDWEMIQVYPGDNSEKSKNYDFRPWVYLKSWGAAAYLINRKGMEKIINRFFVSDLEMKLDQFTKVRLQADHVIYETTVTYVPNDALIVQFNDFKNMDSTIHKSDSVYQMKNAYKYMQNFINKLEQVNSGTVYNTIHIIDMTKSSTSPSPNISNNNNIVVWGSEDLKTLIKKQLSVIYDQIYQVRNPNINIFKFVLLYIFGGYYTDEYQKTKENMNVIPNKIMITNHFMYSPYKYHPFWKYCIKDILNIGNKFNLNNFQKIWEKEFPLDFYSKALSPIPEYRFYELYNKTTDLYTGWRVYRLGDMFLHKSEREKDPYSQKASSKNFHLSKYPKSIASEYLRSTNDEGNYKILSNIIRKRSNRDSIPDKNSLIVQLRVGDVIEQDNYTNGASVSDFLNKESNSSVKSISYYEQLLPEIKRKPINKIILVAGSHIKFPNYNKSMAYINGIKEFFEKNGFKVELRLGKNPDEDLIFISNAKWYIPSGGGFSRILIELIKRGGGTVFEHSNIEKFESPDLYTGWNLYRFGDMFRYQEWREKDPYGQGMSPRNFHLSKYPKSIASEYLRSTNDEGNYKILSNIIKKRTNRNSIPDKNSLIVQLRVGDVIEQDNYTNGASASDFLNYETPTGATGELYVKPISYYEQLLPEIKRKPINKIILVAGSHIKFPNYNKSMAYIYGIKEFFEKNGFKVELRLGKNPDEDLIFISNSKWYIPAGGGFSVILSELVKRNGGGTVFKS